MPPPGVEMGAHGVGHIDLTTLPLDAARAEVIESRRRIEDRIGNAGRNRHWFGPISHKHTLPMK